MSSIATAKIQVLAVTKESGKGERGAWARYQLQCFTGTEVGTIPMYDNVDEPIEPPQAGYFEAQLGWSNYQGRLAPRILKLQPINSSKA